jgi:hypothetical protein
MAITINTSGEHILDQSSGPQDDDVALSADLGALPDPLKNFLELITLAISTGQLNYAADVDAARETASATTFFVNVQATSGETIKRPVLQR